MTIASTPAPRTGKLGNDRVAIVPRVGVSVVSGADHVVCDAVMRNNGVRCRVDVGRKRDRDPHHGSAQ
jgi:hypothetical protein